MKIGLNFFAHMRKTFADMKNYVWTFAHMKTDVWNFCAHGKLYLELLRIWKLMSEIFAHMRKTFAHMKIIFAHMKNYV